MSILTGISEFIGLDIGTTSIRLVQLRVSGATKTLNKYASVEIDSKISLSDSPADQQKVAQAVSGLLTEANITTRNVAVGVSSTKVFTAVADIEKLPAREQEKSIRFQVSSIIPTPIEESKIDWAVLGDSPIDKTKVEVLLSSVSSSFLESRLDALEAIGLNVISFEPDTMALARALVPTDSMTTQIILDLGTKYSDLVIIMNGAPKLMRSIPIGTEVIVKAASQNLNIDEKQAQQFIFKFGLAKDKLEGQIYQSIIATVDSLVSELEKSMKFFQARYVSTKLDRIIVTGSAAILPEFPLYIANKFGLNVEIGNAWRNISFPAERQNEMMAVSNNFAVAAGLAERSE